MVNVFGTDTEEQLLIKKIAGYIQEKKHKVQVLWFGNDNVSCGAILTDFKDEKSSIELVFDDKVLHMPKAGSFIILRVFFLFSPISGQVKSANGGKSIIVDNLSFIKLKTNKRRYPRFMLYESLEAQLMTGNRISSIYINDVSKDGIGFVVSSEKSMLGLAGKSGFIQLNYRDVVARINGSIVWINRFAANHYIGGMVLYTTNKDKDVITDIIFENVYFIEQELFKFLSYTDAKG